MAALLRKETTNTIHTPRNSRFHGGLSTAVFTVWAKVQKKVFARFKVRPIGQNLAYAP
jgi:hypothetical protein